MSTSSQFSIEKPALQSLLDLLGQCGQVVSIFLKPKPAVKPSFESANQPLAELVTTEAFKELYGELGLVGQVIKRFSTLNRLEFEGSLTAVILEGGCHRSTTGISRREASAVVAAGVEAVFPEPFSSIHIFRIDDESWCSLTNEATISSMYVAWESARGLWWVLCVADSD
jgi:hypothetical protein